LGQIFSVECQARSDTCHCSCAALVDDATQCRRDCQKVTNKFLIRAIKHGINIFDGIFSLLDDPNEEFWMSAELEESLSNGEFLKILEVDYFVDELTKILNGESTEELRKELKKIIDRWMDEFSFENVCKNCFHSLNDEQLLQMIKDLIHPRDSPKLLQSYLTQLPTLDEILLFNALTDEYRSNFVKILLAEESKDIRAIIDSLITSILSIGNEDQRKMDEISYWALKQKLKNERIYEMKLNYLSTMEYECLFLETFLLNYRLANDEPNREALETVMNRARLHFEAVEEEAFKRRKKDKKTKKQKKNKEDAPKIKRVFNGWHVVEFDAMDQSVNINNNSDITENSTQTSLTKTEALYSGKRKFDTLSSNQPTRNIYGMKELPYLLSKLFLSSSFKYAMS